MSIIKSIFAGNDNLIPGVLFCSKTVLFKYFLLNSYVILPKTNPAFEIISFAFFRFRFIKFKTNSKGRIQKIQSSLNFKYFQFSRLKLKLLVSTLQISSLEGALPNFLL